MTAVLSSSQHKQKNRKTFLPSTISDCQGKNISKIKFLTKYLGHLSLFQHVDVVLLDPIQQHVAQVEFAAAKQILLVAPNVQLVRRAILDFPIAKVRIKTFF